AKPQLLASSHVLIDVKQALHGGFDVHKLPQVQNGSIHKVDLPANKPLVSPPFIIGDARGLHHWTGVHKGAELLEMCFNSQTGWVGMRPFYPVGALSRGIGRSTQQIPTILPAHCFHSAGQNPPWIDRNEPQMAEVRLVEPEAGDTAKAALGQRGAVLQTDLKKRHPDR